MGKEKSVHMAHDYDDGNPYAPPLRPENIWDDLRIAKLPDGVTLEFRKPDRLKTRWVLIFSLGGILVAYYAFGWALGGIGLFFMSVMNFSRHAADAFYLVSTLVACVFAVIGIALLVFLPQTVHFEFLAAWIAKPLRKHIQPDSECQLVQITFLPRYAKGLRRWDDADDFGYLFFGDSDLRYEGDCCRWALPLAVLQSALVTHRFRLARLRWCTTIEFTTSENLPFIAMELEPRDSTTISDMRMNSKDFFMRLKTIAQSPSEREA